MSSAAPWPRVAFVQDGARLHYAVPLALERAGVLARVFCDWYTPPGSPEAWVARLATWLNPASGARLVARYSAELPLSKILRAPGLALRMALRRRCFASDEAYWEWQSVQVARWAERSGFASANVLAGFVRNVHPGLYEAARSLGVKTVGDQICAPAEVERVQYEKEKARWPQWSTRSTAPCFGIARDLEEATWPLLDRVTCASTFVRDGLVRCGVSLEKIQVIPYPLDFPAFAQINRPVRSGPLRVGYVGRISLQKGSPYFAAVARRLRSAGVQFVMVGPVLADDLARKELETVELVPSVARGEVAMWLSGFDVFYFPSICEGSAGAVMEAMAAGLPIVCSPESGSVVRDGIDGFVVPYADLETTCARLEELIRRPELRQEMGREAREAAERLDLDHYATALRGLLSPLVAEI